MPRPKIVLNSCLCGKPIAQRGNVYPLDAEWRRRHPNLVGALACPCARSNTWYWRCEEPNDGHIPAVDSIGTCTDSWSHLGPSHTLVAAVTTYPHSALRQGAEDYLRHTAHARGVSHEVTRHLRTALKEWDKGPSVTNHRS